MPFRDFATRGGWLMILVFIMFYKLGDAYLGVMANPFYIEMGFTTVEIANVSKVFGIGATLVGARVRRGSRDYGGEWLYAGACRA